MFQNPFDNTWFKTEFSQVNKTLNLILTQGKTIMTALDDLNVSVGALQVSAQNAVNVVATELAMIAKAVATSNSMPKEASDQIEASVANINSIVKNLNDAVASVSVVNTPAAN